ncbi:hypothetical protein BaRGS_00028739, partial [Batillaria attramentaria]
MTSPRPLQTPHSSRLVTLRLRHLSDFDAAKTRRSIKSPARGKNNRRPASPSFQVCLTALPRCYFQPLVLWLTSGAQAMSERTLNARTRPDRQQCLEPDGAKMKHYTCHIAPISAKQLSIGLKLDSEWCNAVS